LVDGFYLGICDYIEEERKVAAAEVIKYITSKEVQKEYIINRKSFSAINELYLEGDTCEHIECDVLNNCRPFSVFKHDSLIYDLDTYVDK